MGAGTRPGAALVPVHPEPVPGDPAVVRWVVPPGTLGFVGEPVDVAEPLCELLDDGTLASVTVEPDAVVLRLGDEHSWSGDGPRVRRHLQAALADPDAWQPPGDASGDDVLARVVEQVLAGEVGDFVRGHGGRIEVLDVADGRVEVALGGACAHCPASDLTLTRRFEDAVRGRFPGLREVVARDPGPSGRRLLPLLPVRRRSRSA